MGNLQFEKRTDMKENQSELSLSKIYDNMMKDYEPSPFISTDWQMQGGVYRQYSEYENNDSCPSGTSGSIRSIIL